MKSICKTCFTDTYYENSISLADDETNPQTEIIFCFYLQHNPSMIVHFLHMPYVGLILYRNLPKFIENLRTQLKTESSLIALEFQV